MDTLVFEKKGLADLPLLASELLSAFPKGRVFAFTGDMGAGKTTLIKSLCKILGVSDIMSSPTFSLINEYKGGDTHSIYHFDLYRLKSQQEALDVGIEEYLYSGDYCFVEWPEEIISLLPEGAVGLQLVRNDESLSVTASVIT